MAFQTKQAPAKVVSLAGEYPLDLPVVSSDSLKRVPGLEDWHKRMAIWYFDFKTVLRRNQDALVGHVNADINALSKYQTDADTRILSNINSLKGTAGYLPRWSDTDPMLTKTSSVFDTGSRVGIGTIGPRKALEVNSLDGSCVRLAFNDSTGIRDVFADLNVPSSGVLEVKPSGAAVTLVRVNLETTALRFQSFNDGYVGLKSPNYVSANLVWTLPSVDGATRNCLQTNGNGTLNFAPVLFEDINGVLEVNKGGTGVSSFSAGLLRTNGGESPFTTVIGNPGTIPKWGNNTLSNSILSESGLFIQQYGLEYHFYPYTNYDEIPSVGIKLFGKYNASGFTSSMAGIFFSKENSTDGNKAGQLSFYTRSHGGPLNSRMQIGSTGVVTLSQLNASKFIKTNGSKELVSTDILASDITSGSALTRVDDTNVTLTLGGTPTTALLAASSLTLGWTGTLSVARGGTAASTADGALTNLLPSQGGNSGKVLSTNGSVTSWISAGSAGTVTSVSCGDLSPVFTSSVATPTAAASITFTLSAQTANKVFSGPTSGGAATPTFRSLVAADIPNIAASTITSAGALTKTDDTNVTLTLGGAPATSLLTATSLTLEWTGTLAATRGGTGTGTCNTGDIIYSSASNTWFKLGIGTAGQVLTVSGGIPKWETTAGTGTVTSVAVSSTDLSVSGSPITTTGTITLNVNTAAITLAKMADLATARFIGRNTAGTGVPESLSMTTAATMLGVAALTTKGDLLGFSTVPARIPIGTDGFVLIADSAQALGLKWATVAGAGTVTSVAVSSTDLSVSGSPITGAGTITLDIKTGAVTLAKMANLATQTFIGRNTSGTGGPESLSMTTARTMLSINNVENTALSTWGGSTNLTSLGTITIGTWEASPVGVNYGGTGSTSSTSAFNALSPLTTKGDLITRNNFGSNIRKGVGSDGQVLTADSTATEGIKWATITGTGSVTSVALTAPSIFIVSGSPITGIGTLAITLATEAANTVLSGPTTGSPSNPTFRALVAADIPNLSAAKITSGTLDPTLGGTGFSSIGLGDILYGAGSNLWAELTGQITSTKKFLTQTGTGSVSAAPVWSTISVSDVGSGAALTTITSSNVVLTLTGGTNALLATTQISADWSGQLSITRGGTGQSAPTAAFDALAPTTTRGDIIFRNASTNTRLAAGTSTYVLKSNGDGTDPSWGQVAYSELSGLPTSSQHSFGLASNDAPVPGGGAVLNFTSELFTISVPGSGTFEIIARIGLSSSGSSGLVTASFNGITDSNGYAYIGSLGGGQILLSSWVTQSSTTTYSVYSFTASGSGIVAIRSACWIRYLKMSS